MLLKSEGEQEPFKISRKLRVLVVDDDKDTVESFAMLVRMDGHDAYTAFDGECAIGICQRESIDIAVLDIKMAKPDGYEVARRLRTYDAQLPLLIALTGFAADSDRARARAAGFDSFLVKPLDFAAFRTLLTELSRTWDWWRGSAAVLPNTSLSLQTVVARGETTDEGAIIEAVTLPWFEIIAQIQRDPHNVHQVSARLWEEIIAGAYKRAGFDEVILTPRSGDLGRDVIATKRGIGQVRVIDQVKAFKPGHLVTANDVRALMGVLATDGASKGFLTTTSDFAPKLRDDPLISPWVPSRLELVNGTHLLLRLKELTASRFT